MSSPSAARPTNPDRPGFADAGWGLALAAALIAVYWPVLRGGFLWDDDAHVTKAALRSLHGLFRIWFEPGATQQYYPVLHSAFWVEHRLWGDAVLGYHAVTLFLHGLATWLLGRLLQRLGVPMGWVAALAFALHPVCVESVAWISEQKNTLSAVFYLGSALAYLRFDSTRRASDYAFALALFVLALLTKSVTATLPAALLVVLWWRRGNLRWAQEISPLVPWLAIGVASGLFTAWTEVHYIGALGADFDLSILQRLLLACHAILFYLGKVLVPTGLMFIYPRWTIDPASLVPWLFVLGVIALAAALIGWKARSRGPIAGFLIFAGTLFPVLGFVNVYPFLFSFVADHFQYLASIGVIVTVIGGLNRWLLRVIPVDRVRTAALLAIPVVLALLSWRAGQAYRDSDSLNRATLARNPDAWLAHYNLAVSLGNEPLGLDEAIVHYRETVRLKPDHWSAHSNLASALLRRPGHETEAIAEYRRALELNPRFAEAANDLGVTLGQDPLTAGEAVASIRRAIALRPGYDGALNNLGNQLLKDPVRRGEAIAAYREAIRLAPGEAQYRYNLANALVGIPETTAEAIAQYREAIRLRPDYAEAHSNLGAVLGRAPGGAAEAASEFETALRLAPTSAQVHAAYAGMLARSPSTFAAARAQYDVALQLAPTDSVTHLDYAVLLSTHPELQANAIAEINTVLELDPTSAVAHYCLAVLILRGGGDRTSAIYHLHQALTLQPNYAPASALLRRVVP